MAGTDSTRIGQERHGAGIGFMIVTTAFFASSDSLVKWIGVSVPLLALLGIRYFFQMSVLGVWQARQGHTALLPAGNIGLQVARSMLLLTNSGCTFAGLRYLPLSVTTALAMLAPIISTLLAATLLKDHVSKGRWALVFLGFIGMLLVVRPGSGSFSWAVVFPIGAATTMAGFQVVSSYLSTRDDPSKTNFLTALMATFVLCLLIAADQAQLMPALAEVHFLTWVVVLLMATAATVGQLLMLQALQRAPLSLLTPFSYAQLAFAALISWLLFSQPPTLWTGIGMCVIAASGISTVMLNMRGRTVTTSPAAAFSAPNAPTTAPITPVPVPGVVPATPQAAPRTEPPNRDA